MSKLVFTYEEPVYAKERPRANYHTPKRTRDCEKAIADAARAAMSSSNWEVDDAPLKVDITILVPLLKKFNAKERKLALDGKIRPTKSDLDNQIKTILDALNEVAYVDDKAVSELVVERHYGNKHLCIVRVTKIGPSAVDLARMALGII